MKDTINQINFIGEGKGFCNFSIVRDELTIDYFEVPDIPVDQVTPTLKKFLVEAYRLGLKRGADLAVEEMYCKVNINQIASQISKKITIDDYARFENCGEKID